MPEASVKLFISYCHRDETLRQQLDKHLAPLKGQKVIEAWHDRQIQAGEKWADQIDDNLNKADIILLLISPDFCASDYCSNIELKQALERHKAEEAIVVPVILEPCDWTWLPFSDFQASPKDGKAITTWGNQNEAFLDVAKGIRAAAESLIEKRQQKAAQKETIKARYLQKVQEALSDEAISDIERDTLDELREELGLTPEEAAEIETHAYEPYRKFEEDRNKYRKTLNKLIDKGNYPFSEEIKRDLELRQRDLGLKAEDVARIERPILAEAEAKYREKLQVEEAERQRQLELEAETQRQLERQHEQEEYESKLRHYEEEFLKAVQGVYPLSESARDGLQDFQHSLKLNAEDVARIERPILAEAEAKYREKLEAEEAERQRQLDEEEAQRQLEQEQAEYENRLRRYEQEFEQAVQAGYPLSQSLVDVLKVCQQQLELKDEDVARIEQPIREPLEVKYHLQLGEALKDQLKFEEAIAEFQKVLQINPNCVEAYTNLGDVLSDQDKLEEATIHCRRALQIDPNHIMAQVGLGAILAQQGEFEEAITKCHTALQLDPNHGYAHAVLGLVLFQQGKSEEAVAEGHTAIQLDPKNTAGYLVLGIVLVTQEKFEEAIALYRTAIQLNPNYLFAYSALGSTLVIQEKFEEAIAVYRTAIQINPNYKTFHKNLADALESQGEFEEAIAVYRTAIQINPNDAVLHNNLGVSLYKQEKFEEAIAEYRIAIQVDSNNKTFHENLSDALKAKKNSIEDSNLLASAKGGHSYYAELRDLLKAGKWKEADWKTTMLMKEVGEEDVYLGVDISKFPCTDLRVIDQLWVKYSNGKFGFSVQKQIWRECYNPTEYNSNWERFGNQVGWRQGLPFLKSWIWEIRIDDGGAIYDISAPKGHLPLPPKKSEDIERRSRALYIESGAMVAAALSGMELGLGGKELWSGLRWVKEISHRLSECSI